VLDQVIGMMKARGILIGELDGWCGADGSVRVRAMDCLPALEHDEDIETASELLIGVASGSMDR
jgi:hypothetical protein